MFQLNWQDYLPRRIHQTLCCSCIGSLSRMEKAEIFLVVLLSCCFLQNTDGQEASKPDCSAVLCLACPDTHLAVTVKNECCPRCIPKCPCTRNRHLIGYCPKAGYLLLDDFVVTPTHTCTCVAVNRITCVPNWA